MRKLIFVFAVCTLAFACGSNEEQPAEEKSTDNATAANTGKYDKGLEIIGSSDCTTCHKISETSTGPAYTDVAKKYEFTEANVDSLAHKVIHGGTGVWGAVPMTPHPTLSLDSAKEAVRYILSLRNQ